MVIALLTSCVSGQPAQAQGLPSACQPIAQLEGESGLVDGVRAYLEARGIRTSGSGDCGGVVARLASVDGMVRVSVTDGTGVEDTRLVSDRGTAAVFIESRVRSDLAIWLQPVDEAPASPASASQALPAVDVEAVEQDRPARGAVRFRTGFSVGSDGSTWLDLAASVATTQGPIAVGLTARGSLDLGLSGGSAQLLTKRGGLDVMVNLEVPIRRSDTMQLSPGVGAGFGWLKSRTREDGEVPDDEERMADFESLRLDLYLRATWRVGPSWSLGMTCYGIIDPFAHTAIIHEVLAGNPVLRAGVALEISYGTQ